ncbi:MAG: AMP-binding protein [Rikenellaceae bacterium]|nr:AMP-binding protein [Rikenellaceae bacterium]
MLQENLIKIYEESFRENHSLPVLTDYFSKKTLTYLEMAEQMARLHILFEKVGIKHGDKIALVGRNDINWCVSYIATITYGVVIVPILQDFNPADIENIVTHSESRLLFAGDAHWQTLDTDRMPLLEAALSLKRYDVVYEKEGSAVADAVKALDADFAAKYPNGFKVEDIKFNAIPNEEMILLNYTSGTTGSSKGVMLSLNNLTGNMVFGRGFINPETGTPFLFKGGRVLSFLPLAHAYGAAFDFLAQLVVGGHITLLGRMPSPSILVEAMKTVKPTMICCVPLVLEKVYRKMIMPMLEKGPMSIAMKIPFVNTALYAIIKSKLLESFGGETNIFIVGGAPMNQETESFLRKINFPLTIGYGMTECAPLISVTAPCEFKQGSCGRYLPGFMDVKIDSPDPHRIAGEIIVRGENVMMGYYKNEEATKAVLEDDGWLHTGDMGIMDPDGTIYIKGRCKTMILTGTGQNIYPEEIEDKLNNLPMVLESLVIESKGVLKALIVPDYDTAEKENINKEALKQMMEDNIKLLNTQVASYEKVALMEIRDSEFEKTPKRSIKRFLYQEK